MNTTIVPQRAPTVIEAPSPPDLIELTISDIDRRTASRFDDIHNCLICTSLRNRGFNAVVGVRWADIEGVSYRFEREMGCEELHFKHFRWFRSSSHYGRRVVGKVIRLYRVK